MASEQTYIEREVNGLTNRRFEGSGAVKAEYRPDVEEWLPTEFSESIDLGRPLDQYYYVYELNDPKRSRAVRKMQKLLKSNNNQVRGVLDTAAAAAVTVGVAAAGPLAPTLAPLAPLAQKAGGMLFGGLMSRLGTALEDTNMTPWSITHTTLYIPELYPVGPLSMFILLSPAAPMAKLHRIRRNDNDPDESEMEPGYEEKSRDYQRGRGMMGLSQPPTRSCPGDLWAQVASKNEPAAWTEPGEDRAGFRVLVPHAQAGSEARYVSALRADVLRRPARPNPGGYRP